MLAHREYLNAFVRECYRTRANPWCVYHPGVGFFRIHVFTECYRTVSLGELLTHPDKPTELGDDERSCGHCRRLPHGAAA